MVLSVIGIYTKFIKKNPDLIINPDYTLNYISLTTNLDTDL